MEHSDPQAPTWPLGTRFGKAYYLNTGVRVSNLNPMARTLPPLNGLRAFEAAARHLSFKRAADELCVTPAAVSQQIKALEQHLQVDLFRRQPDGLRLTRQAQAGLPKLLAGFDSLRQASQLIRSSQLESTLTVVVSLSFAAKWLVPRLSDFQSRHPQILVRVSCITPSGPRGIEGDLVIVYDQASAARPEATLLMRERVFPVWSPQLESTEIAIHKPLDLLNFPLIHDENMAKFPQFPKWPDWLAQAGIETHRLSHGPRLPLSSMAMDAAINGNGVALGRSVLVATEMKSGRLRGFADMAFRTEFGYFLENRAPGGRSQPQIAAFRAWLEEQAAVGEPDK